MGTAFNRQKILIVDDESANIEILNEILQDDYQIFFSTNGEEALEVVASQRPDMVLLDIMMPKMDGLAVCARLKSDPVLFDIPVIFVTALADEKDETTGLELGAVDYITKPFNPVIVKLRVANHLELKLNRDQLSDQTQILRGLVHISQSMVFFINCEQQLVEFNPAAVSTLGYAKKEIKGNHFSTLFHDSGQSSHVVEKAASLGYFSGEVSMKRKNGEIIPVSLTASPIFDVHDQVIGVIMDGRELDATAVKS